MAMAAMAFFPQDTHRSMDMGEASIFVALASCCTSLVVEFVLSVLQQFEVRSFLNM
jgi:hypothetical protein